MSQTATMEECAMTTLWTELDRTFSELDRRLRMSPAARRTTRHASARPGIHVSEAEDSWTLAVDLPGVPSEEGAREGGVLVDMALCDWEARHLAPLTLSRHLAPSTSPCDRTPSPSSCHLAPYASSCDRTPS